MKSRYYTLAIIIVMLVLAVGSCRKAGTWLVKSDEPAHADAMIMLMGGIAPDRILQITDLYQENVAGQVWIVEEGSGAMGILGERGVQMISNTRQVHNALLTVGIPADSIIILPGGATSTQMEAEIARDYLARRPGGDPSVIDTLLLVSSASHMRRASMIFKAAVSPLDDPPVICTWPSSYSDFNAGHWWKNREDIQDVFFEYLKIANFMLFERRKLK